MSRRLIALLAVIFACLGLAAGTGPEAIAATTTPANYLGATGILPPATDDGILCEVGVDYPHKSTHVPTTVNVSAEVDCSDPVTLIDLTVDLYRNGVLVNYNFFAKGPGSTLIGRTHADCVTGNYTAEADVTVDFPTGFPRVISDTFYSPTIHITC